MAGTINQKSNLISASRASMTKLLEAAAELQILRQRADDMGWLTTAPLVDGDFVGDNLGIVASEFIAALPVADQAVSQANRRTIVKVRY